MIEDIQGIHAFVCEMPEELGEESDDETLQKEGTEIEMAWMGECDSLSIE